MASSGSSKAYKTNQKLPATVSQNLSTGEVVETFIIIPPDGGWGWVVAVTSFICNYTADGTMYTFGIFLDDISLSIGSTPSDVALANSLMTGFYYLSGPLISALTNRFGYRVVSMLGGLISCVSILITSYSTTLSTVLLVYGVAGGVGFGMMYVPSIVVIGFYFERWRAIATSIAVCGSSLGIISFPIVFKGLLDHTEWRFKFRILSILCFFCALVSILYRPLHPVRVVTVDEKKRHNDKESLSTVFRVEERESGLLSRYHNVGYPTAADVHGLSTIALAGPLGTSSLSVFSTGPSTSTKSFVKSKLPNISSSKMSVVQPEKLGTVYEDAEEEYGDRKIKRCLTSCKRRCLRYCWFYRRNPKVPARPLYRDDIFYSGSLAMLPQYIPTVHNTPTRLVSDKSMVDYHLSVTRVFTIEELEEENKRCICCPISVKRTLVTMLDMSLLKSPSFLLLSFSGLFTTLGLYTPFLFIADRAKHNGMEDHLAYYLISALGIANTVGRIACGVMSSLPNIKALFCSYVSLTICGMAVLVSSFSYQKVWQFGSASVFGLTVACVAALRPVIIAEMVGLEKLTNGFGLCLLFQGVACLTGLPLSGLLIRLTGDYEMSFYFAGGVILLSAIMLMPLNAVLKWETKHAHSQRVT